jgi:hypothetical protein
MLALGCRVDTSGLVAGSQAAGGVADAMVSDRAVAPSPDPPLSGVSPPALPDAMASRDLAHEMSVEAASEAAVSMDASDGLGDASLDAAVDERVNVGPGCALPSGATICCGKTPCTDHGGSCRAVKTCTSCTMKCTNPARPVCCAMSGGGVTCEVAPVDC